MNNDIIVIEIWKFAILYLFLLITLIIMKICKIDKSKTLIIGSIRMTVQLTLAGFILTYIFKDPKWWMTFLYLIVMALFAFIFIIRRNKWLNKKFILIIFFSLIIAGIGLLMFFVGVIVSEFVFNPQYTIPIAGMIIGNAMTGLTLALRSFYNSYEEQKQKLISLNNLGIDPKKLLLPIVKSSIETSIMPTINSMMGMGIVSLPGMMTGQILSGISPMTAIVYQISIIILITTVVTIVSFSSLIFGYKTIYDIKRQLINI